MTEKIISLSAPETELLLTRTEAAKLLRITPGTLANWASAGIGPRSRKIGRGARYLRREVEAFVESCFEQEAA